MSRSEAIRKSILDAASALRRKEALRAEVAALEADEEDQHEMQEVISLMRVFVQRGDVDELRPPKGVGHDQRGRRFGVVVQADAFLPRSVVLVAPTSRSARSATFRPEIVVAGETTRVLADQLGAVAVSQLGSQVGHASTQEIWGIDESLLTVLGLR
jgi:mRNA interferase MazF